MSRHSYRWMLASQALGSFGNSLTWTGLPILFAQLTGRTDDIAVLFFSQTVASLLLTLAGGHFADRWNKKTIGLICSALEISLLIGFFLMTQYVSSMAIAFLGLSTSLIGAFGGSAMSVWFAETAQHNEKSLERGVGRRNSYMMMAKLGGMALGPLLYGYLGLIGLLVDAAFAVLVFICLTRVAAPVAGRIDQGKEPIWKSIVLTRFTPAVRNLLALAFLGGVTSFPLINAGLYSLREVWSAPEIYVSAFWLTGAVGSLAGNTVMSRGWTENFGRSTVYTSAMVFSMLGILGMALSPGPASLIISFGLVTLVNPAMNNLSFTRLVLNSESAERGRLVALAATLTDISVLILLSAFVAVNQHMPMPSGLLWVLPLVLLRIPFVAKALKS